MEDIDENALALQATQVRNLVEAVLAQPGGPLPESLAAALFDFSVLGQSHPCYAQASESSRSLASLVHAWGARAPGEQERVQLTVLGETLLQELSPVALLASEAHRPLVPPIMPSLATENPRIALCIDNAPLLVVLKEVLGEAGFEPVVFDSLAALSAVGEKQYPTAVIAELSLCRLNPDAADVFANLRNRFSPAPHLICLAQASDIAARLDAVRLGATRFLALPLDVARLVAILKGITVQVPPRPFRVVIVDDDPFLSEVYREGLETAGISTRAVTDPLLAPDVIGEFKPDLIVCDIFMPGCNGLELLALLRQDDDLADTPIMLLSSDPDLERRLEALNLGADDFLMKPVDMDLLIAAVTARARRARMLKRSRSELRYLQERVRSLEGAAGAEKGAITVIDLEAPAEPINMDDYVVSVIDENGRRGWSRRRKKPAGGSSA